MSITDIQKKAIVKDLAANTYYQAGVNAGLDRIYKNKNSIISKVRKIYLEVQAEPEKFGVSQDIVDLVKQNLGDRNAIKVGKTNAIIEAKNPKYEMMEVKDLVDSGSKKSMILLQKKIDMLGSSKKKLDDVSISALAQVAGILFDKRQITKGEATEHIAMIAKVDDNLTPKQKLDMLLKFREINNNG